MMTLIFTVLNWAVFLAAAGLLLRYVKRINRLQVMHYRVDYVLLHAALAIACVLAGWTSISGDFDILSIPTLVVAWAYLRVSMFGWKHEDPPETMRVARPALSRSRLLAKLFD